MELVSYIGKQAQKIQTNNMTVYMYRSLLTNIRPSFSQKSEVELQNWDHSQSNHSEFDSIGGEGALWD